MERRDFLRLAALGVGAVFASGIGGCAREGAVGGATTSGGEAPRDFYFLHMSDIHWGYRGAANPDPALTLRRAIDAMNALSPGPDFVVLTGDLTQMTDDRATRARRMRELRAILAELRAPRLHFLPGEHDASLDGGDEFREVFGDARWSFDHRGVRFVGLDNVSDPDGALGEAQIAWLRDDLARVPHDRPLVVLAHRPLFDLYPAWDWATKDGARALALLEPFARATVLYGHVHQEHHHVTGRVAHHAARSLVFPLPAPGSVPKKAPLPWDPAARDHGVGFRVAEVERGAIATREVPT